MEIAHIIIVSIPLIVVLILLISIITISIIGIKKLFQYLDAKTEYYKNNKN